jgi:hypothetical protein
VDSSPVSFTRAELQSLLDRALAGSRVGSGGFRRPFDSDITIEQQPAWCLRIPGRGLRNPHVRGALVIGAAFLVGAAATVAFSGTSTSGWRVTGALGALFLWRALLAAFVRTSLTIDATQAVLVRRLGPLSWTRRFRSPALRAHWAYRNAVNAAAGIRDGRYLVLEDGVKHVRLLELVSAMEQDWISDELNAFLRRRTT